MHVCYKTFSTLKAAKYGTVLVVPLSSVGPDIYHNIKLTFMDESGERLPLSSMKVGLMLWWSLSGPSEDTGTTKTARLLLRMLELLITAWNCNRYSNSLYL